MKEKARRRGGFVCETETAVLKHVKALLWQINNKQPRLDKKGEAAVLLLEAGTVSALYSSELEVLV